MAKQVLVNATVYTGETRIDNGYVRFDEQVLEVGKMEEFVKDSQEEVTDISGKLVVPGFIDVGKYEVIPS